MLSLRRHLLCFGPFVSDGFEVLRDAPAAHRLTKSSRLWGGAASQWRNPSEQGL